MKKIKVTSMFIIIVLLISGLFFGCSPDNPGVEGELYLYIGLYHGCAGSGDLDEAATSVNGIYSVGEGVTAAAVADSGSVFAGWYDAEQGGNLVSSENPYSFDIEADTCLYASFSDPVPPAEVSDFSISHIGEGVAIMDWSDSPDSDFDHVEISASPADVSTVTVSEGIESATLTGLSSETSYTISLKTVDAEGNKSSGISFNMYIPASFTRVSSFITDSDGAVLNTLLGNDVTNGTGGYYILAVDVNLDGVSWTPVGDDTSPFTGTFDGGGRTISNLTINSLEYYQGLFGYTSGTLSNVCLEDASVTGTGHAGALAGRNDGGTINNCLVADGDVSGTGAVGGLAGSNTGLITGSSAAGSISGTGSNIGGLVGYNNGPVSGSHAVGTVSGPQHVGGLMGKNESTVTDSYAEAAVSGTGYFIGGLAGENNGGTVNSCCATGEVSGSADYAGGLLGENNGGTVTESYAAGPVSISGNYAGGFIGENSGGSVADCYATGAVSGSFHVGGLAGTNNSSGTVTNSYAAGAVSGSGNAGALAGQNLSSAAINYCYADSTVNSSLSLIAESSGSFTGSILSTVQMQDSQNYHSSWDFTNTWEISSSINSGYPFLRVLADTY